MKDTLAISKMDIGFEIRREIVENITPDEMDKRIAELERNKKQFFNEIEKAEVSITTMQKELNLIDRNITMLLEAKEKGSSFIEEER